MDRNYDQGEKVLSFFANVASCVCLGALWFQGSAWFHLADKAVRTEGDNVLLLGYTAIFFVYFSALIWLISVRPEDGIKRFFRKIWNGMLH